MQITVIKMNVYPFLKENEAVTICGGRIKDPSQYPSAFHRGEQVNFSTRAYL
jgi:hypothetical protein